MSDNNKSYRIRTNVGSDSVLNVNLNQDFNVLEVLSLKIGTDNLYRFHTSDYGCIAGRVLANGNFGIPNAKISIFIAVDSADTEDDIISYLYPYKTTATRNSDKIRYNLLPEEQLSDCHRNVGTFPSKRTVLDDNHVLEVYDKYYKYTTRSNESGDYMIFGVPTGAQTLHVDIDLSDIGILSQRPRDMIYKGYNITQFENGNMFKKSNDLDSLAQIISQNQSVYVYPFWGDESEGEIAITRRDIEIQYEFTSTCVFIGSLITDEASNGISKRCIPSERMGKMDRLTTGNGTIEMIRKKADGSVEEVSIQGNTLIDGNGTWCYQIPMNLDYVRTDEYGNTVPTDDPNKGIATRACVRFRFSLTEFENEGGYSRVSKVLVPHNPQYYSNAERGNNDGAVLDYVFGTNTDDASFKNLFLNNVYTVKSFIPRFQMLNIDRNKRFSGIKAVNVNNGNNPIPYNNIRVDLTFMFTLQCAVFKVLLWAIGAMNAIISAIASIGKRKCCGKTIDIGGTILGEEFSRCLYIGEGYCPEMDGWYFAPNCKNDKLMQKTYKKLRQSLDVTDTESIDYANKDESENGGRICLTKQIDHFIQCVELNLAMEYDVIQLDFYNDWMNGMIYVPRWFADIRPKRSYFFGVLKTQPRVRGCMEDNLLMFSRRYTQQCSLTYTATGNSTDYTEISTPVGCKDSKKQKCHKSKGRQYVKIFTLDNRPNAGVVHDQQVSYNNTAYYFRPCEWLKNGKKCNLFATDLVLLGNLEKNNMQGIPQSFEKLSASSYQIPDTLASTNLGVEGFLYGNGEGAICNGVTDEGVKQIQEDKEGVINWTKGKDFYETEPYDNDEDIVTESAGIDWGFSGPDQGENNLTELYFPGGHFLGVSCINSETNIKSCINLSRICEIGSLVSQRQTLIGSTTDGNGYVYEHTVPTGLISGEAINDYGFKNEFATLNYNGLKIRKNPETLMNEYDFEAIYPLNFNGELSNFTGTRTKYNITSSTETNRTRTIETHNKDYYRFRLGLSATHTRQDSEKKYLISMNSGAKVALPVYENSFYFYFGLKNGSTALDRFFKEFYAQCPEMKPYAPSVSIDIIENSDICTNNGKIKVTVKNIDKAQCIVEYEGRRITEEIIGQYIFENLPGGKDIMVSVGGEDISTITRTLRIPINYPPCIENLSYSTTDYTVEYPDGHTTWADGVGYITFSGDTFNDTKIYAVGVVTMGITRSGKPLMKLIKNQLYHGLVPTDIIRSFSAISETMATSIDGKVMYGWGGNQEYTIYVWYACDWYGQATARELDKVTLSMPESLDIRFGSEKYASYNNIIVPLINSGISATTAKTMWINYMLDSGYQTERDVIRNYIGTTAFNSAQAALENTLAYRNSVSSLFDAGGSIDYEIVGGTPPYKLMLRGYGEKLDYGSEDGAVTANSVYFSTDTSASAAGYNLSMDSFILPTINCPNLLGYYYDYVTGGTRGKFTILRLTDADGKLLSLSTINSYYMPFFFRALCVEYYGTDWASTYPKSTVKMAASNPIGTSLKFYYNDDIISSMVTSNTNRFDINTTGVVSGICMETTFNTISSTNKYLTDTAVRHHFSISDRAGTSEDNVDVKFIGDKEGSNEYYPYDNRVRYFKVTKSFIDNFISGSTVYAISGGTKYIPYDVMGNTLAFTYSSGGFTVAGAISGWSPITQTIIMDGEYIKYFYTGTVYSSTALRKIMGVDGEISESDIRDTGTTISGSYVMGMYCSNYTVDDTWITRVSAYTISASVTQGSQTGSAQIIEQYNSSTGRTNIYKAAKTLDGKLYTVNPRHKSSSIIIRFYSKDTFNQLKNDLIPH